MFLDFIGFSFVTFLLYITLIPRNADYKSWLIFGSILAIILGRFIYLAIRYFIPCFNDKTALELDKDKLQLFIKGKLLFQISRNVAYWKEIEDIQFNSPPLWSTTSIFKAVISFKMNDGSVFCFGTKYIAGKDREINNTIMEHFKNQ